MAAVDSVVASGLPVNANSNIEALTTDAILAGIFDQVWLESPFLTAMLDRERVIQRGGKTISRVVRKATRKDHVQSYSPEDGLTAARKTTLETPYFKWKFMQIPIVYNVEEMITNEDAGAYQIGDLIANLADEALDGLRLGLMQKLYGDVSDATRGGDLGDGQKGFQSIYQALQHHTSTNTLDYGGLKRETYGTDNQWWQGANLDRSQSTSMQETVVTASVYNFRRAVIAVGQYGKRTRKQDLICIVGPDIWLKLKQEVEARKIHTTEGRMFRYGFDTYTIDGIDVVKDDFLTDENMTAATTPSQWFFLLDLNTWEFRVHPKRNFRMTPWKWQGDREEGHDQTLARILLAGNNVCWMPRRNIMLRKMS